MQYIYYLLGLNLADYLQFSKPSIISQLPYLLMWDQAQYELSHYYPDSGNILPSSRITYYGTGKP